VESLPPRLPTPREALFVWMVGVALLVGIGIGVGLLAAALAIAEGLSADAAFALISDPVASPLVTSSSWICANIAANEIAVLGLLALWRRRTRAPLADVLPLAKPSRRALLGAVLLPFAFAPLAEVAGELMYRAMPNEITAEHLVIALARTPDTLGFALALLAAAALPALVEETMFRGFITSAFRQHSSLVAVLVPSLMFGLFHLEPTQAAGTMVLGVAFGLVRLYTGSLWACIASHFAYNAGVLLEVRYLDASNDHVLHWGRVGLGLLLAVPAYALLVGDLLQKSLQRLSLRPPHRSGDGR
jgi:membrane protease YdiL (CAAX protease family)